MRKNRAAHDRWMETKKIGRPKQIWNEQGKKWEYIVKEVVS